MEHTLVSEKNFALKISVIEQDKEFTICINNNNSFEEITLTPKELHSFIGTLLHVQAKLKTANNG